MDNALIIFLIAAIALAFIIYVVIARSKSEQRIIPNYRAMFVLGISFVPIGIASNNSALLPMGIIFLLAGLGNKDKWGKETKWGDLSPELRRAKLIVGGGLTLLLIAAIVFVKFIKGN